MVFFIEVGCTTSNFKYFFSPLSPLSMHPNILFPPYLLPPEARKMLRQYVVFFQSLIIFCFGLWLCWFFFLPNVLYVHYSKATHLGKDLIWKAMYQYFKKITIPSVLFIKLSADRLYKWTQVAMRNGRAQETRWIFSNQESAICFEFFGPQNSYLKWKLKSKHLENT